MLTALISLGVRRTELVERIVTERTAALALATQKTNTDAAHIRAIVEHSADGIITIDSHGLIHDINPAAEKIFGYASAELIERNIAMLLPPEDRVMHDTYLERSTLNASRIINQARELHGYRKDKSTFPMELNVSSMMAGKKRLFIGILRDISTRKQTEKLKNEFISTVSHELRTPLTSIKGALGLITSGTMGHVSEKINELIKIAYNNCERQISIVNDLLDIEKISTGKMEYHMESICLNDLLNQAIKENHAYGKGHQVTYVVTSKK